MSLLKLIGVLLDYPQEALWEHGEELLAAAQDDALPPARRKALVQHVRDLLATDPLLAQERWLELFDRGRSMSLLLFEHIHGESRDRGQAMVDLIEAYRRNGFELSARELPDYLPLLLETLVEYASGAVDFDALRRRARLEPRDDTPEVMDQLWEEEAVRFGAEAPAQDCAPSARRTPQPAAVPSHANPQVQP